MKDRNIKVYYAPLTFGQYYSAFALDEDDNLVWVSNYSTDDPKLLDIDDWYGECVIDIPDVPVPLHRCDYDINYDSKDRQFIGGITLRYVNEQETKE